MRCLRRIIPAFRMRHSWCLSFLGYGLLLVTTGIGLGSLSSPRQPLREARASALGRRLTSPVLRTLRGHTEQVLSVAFAKNGGLLVSGGTDQTVRLWDVATGKERTCFKGHGNAIVSVAFSANDKIVVSADWSGTIKLWDVKTAKEIRKIQAKLSSLLECMAVSPDGKYLASGGGIVPLGRRGPPRKEDAELVLWETATGKKLRTFRGHTGLVKTVAFTSDGKMLASGSFDRTVRLWETASGKELAVLRGHTSLLKGVAFAPGDKILASGSDELSAIHPPELKLWDVAVRKEIASLEEHRATTNAVAFSPDGKVLASGGDDSTIKLWDVAHRQALGTLRGHDQSIVSLAYSPDGTILASASADTTVKLWSVGPRFFQK